MAFFKSNILLLFMVCSFSAKAQLTQQRKYGVGLPAFNCKTLNLNNNGLLLASIIYGDSTNVDSTKNGTVLVRLNNNYDTVWVKRLPFFFLNDFLLSSSNEIILVGSKTITNNIIFNYPYQYGFQILKLNLNGNLILSKYKQSYANIGSGNYLDSYRVKSSIVEYKQNYFIVSIMGLPLYSNTNDGFFLLKLDNDLNIVQKKVYDLNYLDPIHDIAYNNKIIRKDATKLIIYNGSNYVYNYYNNVKNKFLVIDTNLSNTLYKELIDSTYQINKIESLGENVLISGSNVSSNLVNNQYDNNSYYCSFITKVNLNTPSSFAHKNLLLKPNYAAKFNYEQYHFSTYNNQIYGATVGNDDYYNGNDIVHDSLSKNFRIRNIKLDTLLNIKWNKRLHIYGSRDTTNFGINFFNTIHDLNFNQNQLLFRNDKVLNISYASNYYFQINSVFKDELGLSITSMDTLGNNALCNITDEPLLFKYDSLKIKDNPIINFVPSTLTLDDNSQTILNIPLLKIANNCLPLLKPKSKFFWYPLNSFTGNDQVVCKDSKLILYDISYNEPKTWHWIFPPQANVSELDSLYLPYVQSISFTQAGTYPVKLVTTNDAGTDTSIQYITVINFIPQPNLGNDTLLCKGDSLRIIYKNPPNSYHYFSGDTISTDKDTIVIKNTGQYIINAYTACGSLYDTINVTFADRPTAKFIATTTCNNLTAQFIDSSLLNYNPSITHQYAYKLATAPAAAYTNFSTQPSPSFTFPSYDSFDIRLIVSSSLSCVTNDTIIKRISLQPKPVAVYSYTNTCGTLNATFTNSSTIAVGAIAQHRWFLNGVLINSNLNFNYTFNNYGTYIIKYVAQSTTGCISDTAIQTVIIKDKPIATLTYNNNACANTNFIITASNTISNATITNHKWLVNNTLQSTNTNTITPNLNVGTYTIQYISTTNQGCISDTVTKIITVQTKPQVNFTTANGCVNEALTFTNNTTNTVGNPLNYQWQINNINEATTTNLNKIFTNGGNYAIQLKASTVNGCSDSVKKIITIETKPIADFTYDSACLLKPILFTSASTNITGAITATNWDFGNGQTANTPIATTSYNTQNNYTVTLQVATANGCTATVSKVIPITPVQITATSDTTIAANQPLQLQASGAANYIWTPSFGLSNPSLPNPIAILQQSQQYQVQGTTTGGCVGYTDVNITVYKDKGLYIPTIFTPNNDGINDTWKIICSGVQQLNYLKVYNRWGQLVHQQSNCNQAWNGNYNGKPLPVGAYVYLYEVIDFTNTKITGKGTVVVAK
jgi:gliding motility-associated-like protein